MINRRNYLVIDGRSSLDFGVYISGGGTYKSPERSYEEVEVPGRNGVILIDKGHYKNIDVTYSAFIFDTFIEKFEENINALRSFLISRNGYVRIEDTYHPDEFRLGYYNDEFDPDIFEDFKAGQFDITFKCKPQRFLKSGELKLTHGTDFETKLCNPTNHKALPLIRAYGTGTFTIAGKRLQIRSANQYTDIDCDLQEAYKNTFATSCNNNIALTDGVFPCLEPGDNTISIPTSITKFEITPRWWTV